ncbi:hypothetical protein ABIB81_008535 [Bradyrhizobium sp. I1.7.5]
MNETLFTSLAQARVTLGCWRVDYNDTRPHAQLGWRTASEFAMTCHPRRDLALRYAEGSAPAPFAATAQPGKIQRQGRTQNWIKPGGKVTVDTLSFVPLVSETSLPTAAAPSGSPEAAAVMVEFLGARVEVRGTPGLAVLGRVRGITPDTFMLRLPQAS